MTDPARTDAPPPDPHRDPRRFLRALYDRAVQQALPQHNLAAWLPLPPSAASGGRTVVVGAGKAGGAMAAGFDALWPAAAPLSGLVITRYHHVPPAYLARPGRIEVVEASHPVPDAAGRAAAARITELVRDLTADDLVVALVSGGASALLSLPAAGLTLEDKQAVNRALLASGAAIDEMNCVRKHLSAIKGGRLAAMCAPARVVTLLISDVPGDEPAIIGSGPTVPDPTTCTDALAICRRHGIALPPAALAGLEGGAFETPKPGAPVFAGHEVHMTATPQQSLEAAAALARAAGIEAHVLSDEIEGESREVGKVHAALARAVARRGAPAVAVATLGGRIAASSGSAPFGRPCVLLSGGETTVTVRARPPGQPAGRGGRAGEFLLGCAIALQGQGGVHALAADTDGIDGIEANAGAIVTPDTLARAAAQGLKPAEFLDRNDAYSFFAALGDLVVRDRSPTPARA